MKKIQDDNARIEILRYNDAYICSLACYGVTHTRLGRKMGESGL